MNSPLPSVNLVDFALSQINKQPTGSLEISSGTSLGSLNINDVLTLDLIQTIADSSSSSAVKVQISANGQTLELSPDAKLELPLPQSANGQTLELSPNAKLELPLPQNAVTDTTQMQVKITSMSDTGITFRIVKFNGQEITPEAEAQQSTSIQTDKTFPSTITAKPLSQIVEALSQRLQLPTSTTTQLVASLPDAELLFNQPVLSEQATNVASPSVPTSSQLSLPANISAPLTEILTSPQPLAAKAEAIVKLFANLQGTSLPAQTVSYPQTTVLQTPLGILYPDTPVKVPEHIRLEVAIKELQVKPQADLSALLDYRLWNDDNPLPSLTPLLDRGTSQPQLSPQDSLTKILKQMLPPEQAQLLNQKIPQPDSKNFISDMVGFIKASRSHNLSDWLGKGVVAELNYNNADGAEVVNQLNNVVINSSREAGAWRMVDIPILTEAGIANIRLVVKHNPEDDEEDQPDRPKRPQGGTRFVIDSTFTNLGRFQFDGIALEHQRRFDLIIRTERYIEDDLCSNLVRLFTTTLQAQNYVGVMSINRREKFVHPWNDAVSPQADKGGILV